ncbi:MAG: hypothetical protein K2J93_06025 [Anaeroplasmataceae bacterium]|nr:hypothetical protein [Anaeroplasmataceae bacterium]
MLYEYIQKNYEKDEPIFLSELPFENKQSLRQEMKRLTDEGKLARVYNGVYYQCYKTVLGTNGNLSMTKYINKKYLKKDGKTNGFIAGLSLANQYGFTSQVPSVIEIVSNDSSTRQRKVEVDGYKLIIYSPVFPINEANLSAIQFLDLMSNIHKYSELTNEERKRKLKEFIIATKVDFNEVKKYIYMYPDRVYKNIFEGGLMNELV